MGSRLSQPSTVTRVGVGVGAGVETYRHDVLGEALQVPLALVCGVRLQHVALRLDDHLAGVRARVRVRVMIMKSR